MVELIIPDSPDTEATHVAAPATDNLRIRRSRPLIAPAILAEEIPLLPAAAQQIAADRQAVSDIVHGRDPRLLVIVGPCSVHDSNAVLDYAERLFPLAQDLASELLIVLRVYFEKPRTTIGWKGYINDPKLDGSFAVNAGLRGARELLAQLTAMGLPAATEFLDTTFGQYYSDFISWAAIGARTVESQIHRQLASGLSMPVGIKNGTAGNIGIALDAIVAANNSHLFPSLTKEGAPALLETTGNPDCHLVLRGGSAGPNYHPQDIQGAVDDLERRDITTGIVVDCSHGNSNKQHAQQLVVARDVVEQRKTARQLCGLMLESHLLAGRQDQPTDYGRSITDACIGWAETQPLLEELANASARAPTRRT